jgi:L-rhamnose-H+ transport protein
MENHLILGFVSIVAGGMMQGSYVLPMKYTREWKWENTWLIFSILAMLVLPWVTVFSTTSGLAVLCSHSKPAVLLAVCFFGLCWGVGCVLYGQGVMSLGIALGTALILGIAATLGSLVPLLVQHPAKVFETAGVLTLVGVAIMLSGIIVCAIAGRERDQWKHQSTQRKRNSQTFIVGIVICVLSGIFSAAINFGFALGQQITAEAHAIGNSRVAAVYPVLALLMTSGFIANAGYSVYLLNRNRSWAAFCRTGTATSFSLAALMGILLFSGYVLYGVGINQLAALGPSTGWSLFISTFVLTANISGLLTGEWRDAGDRARRLMYAGSLILLIAVAIIGAANGV